MEVISCNPSHEEDKSVGKSARFYRRLKGSAEMPNLCLVCHESFISSAALTQHLIGKHSDLQCYECNHCGKKGKQKNNVKTFCNKRHGEVNFEIVKINEKETECFVQKNSFKGTLIEYNNSDDNKAKSKKRKVKKIVKSIKTDLTYSAENSADCLSNGSSDGCSSDDNLSNGSSDEQSSNDGLSEDNSHGINFEFVDLNYDFNSTKEIINIQIKIPLLLEEKISNILKSKIINCIHEFELLSNLSKRN
jgi:hypothetical protein